LKHSYFFFSSLGASAFFSSLGASAFFSSLGASAFFSSFTGASGSDFGSWSC